MAQPVRFPEADAIEDYPAPATSHPLPVKRFPRSTVSCWQLDPIEQREVSKTGRIWLRTRTFAWLDPAPSGERWQPDVLVSALKEEVFANWTDQRTDQIASDRIVHFDENQSSFLEARKALSALSRHLQHANNLGALTDEEVNQAKFEVHLLEQMLACSACRVDWVLPAAVNCLRWIATKSAEAFLQQLALNGLAAIIKLFRI